MLKNQIPGHVLAHTWRLMIVATGTAWLATHRWHPVLGAAIFVIGEFLGNQATHLEQENHANMALTWIERQQQKHPLLFQRGGLLVIASGIWVAFH